MKNTILYLLVISFMLQSCYSYKAISLKETPLVVGKKYKIRQEDNFIKAKLKITNDSVITVMEGDVEKDIYISNIKEIKIQKFSVSKTVLFSVGMTLTTLLLIVAASGPLVGDFSGPILLSAK